MADDDESFVLGWYPRAVAAQEAGGGKWHIRDFEVGFFLGFGVNSAEAWTDAARRIREGEAG